MTPRIKNA